MERAVPAYMIFDIEITDQAAYDAYLAVGGKVLAASGGEFVFSSTRIDPLEGGWKPASLSMVKFPTKEAARAFYDSPAYQEVIGMRQKASIGRGVIVDA